jgi:hypothetical protein
MSFGVLAKPFVEFFFGGLAFEFVAQATAQVFVLVARGVFEPGVSFAAIGRFFGVSGRSIERSRASLLPIEVPFIPI